MDILENFSIKNIKNNKVSKIMENMTNKQITYNYGKHGKSENSLHK